MKLHRMPLLITSLFVLASCGSAGVSSQTSEHVSSSAQEKQSSEKSLPESSKTSSTEVPSSSVESSGEESWSLGDGSTSGDGLLSSDSVTPERDSSDEETIFSGYSSNADVTTEDYSSSEAELSSAASSDEISFSEEISSESEDADASSEDGSSNDEIPSSDCSSDIDGTSGDQHSADDEKSSDYSEAELSSNAADSSEGSSPADGTSELYEKIKEKLGMTPVLSEDGKSLTYGLYPQTHVSEETEKSTVDSLNAMTAAEAEGNGWYLLDGEYYAKAAANSYDYGYKFDDGTAISSGTAYWFRCEPIKWDILKTEEGSYFLLSDRLLDAHRYNEDYTGKKNGYYANSYENSEIRAWLNGTFYNSAFALDSSLVMETEVDNSASTTYSSSNSYACDATKDKVFLPSYQDYKNADYGFSTSYSDYDAARQCKTTDWARANYALCSTSSSYYNNGWYWTRSPNPSDSCYASCVIYGGSLNSGNYVYGSCSAVRPCLKLRRTA